MWVSADEAAVHEGSGRTIEWMPAADFYPQYIADPLRPQSALKILYMVDRFAFELVRGRSVMGEFAFRDETSVGVGWFFDF